MIAETQLDELRQLHQHATSVGGDGPIGMALRDALPDLIDEIDQLRAENQRLRSGIGQVKQLLEPAAMTRALAQAARPSVSLV